MWRAPLLDGEEAFYVTEFVAEDEEAKLPVLSKTDTCDRDLIL